jgi:hypothetical protein
MRKSLLGAFGIFVSVFLVWWVLRGENYQDVIEKIANANFWYLFLCVLVGTLGYLIRALRWKVLLEPMALETSLRSRFASVSMGFAANNLFPFRIGEIVRPVSLSKMESISTSGVIGSLVVERFLDSVTVFSMLFLVTMMPSFQTRFLQSLGRRASSLPKTASKILLPNRETFLQLNFLLLLM